MTRLGIPLVRIAQRLNIHRKTGKKYAQKNDELFNKIHQDFKGGSSITKENDLVFDPMAGGAVVADTCLAFNRKCWSFDLLDRIKTRPEIEPFLWDHKSLVWPVPSGKKPDLIFFDPPYFKKMAEHYMKGSISDFSRSQYLKFFKDLFYLLKEHSKQSTRIAFLNADFRDFQGIPAIDEDPENAILLLEYAKLLENCGWKITHLIDCPLSTERFLANMVVK
jgi:hypothetical protein